MADIPPQRYERRPAQQRDMNDIIDWCSPTYDDLPPMPIVASRLGASAPTLAEFKTGIYQYTFDATNDVVYGATEITHGWQEGTTIYPHIHWATNGLEATAKGVKWQIIWSVGDGDEAFGAVITRTVDTEIPASTADRTHLISEFTPAVVGTDRRIGAYIVWSLSRIATKHANGAPAADPFALAIGFHVLQDTTGSTGRFVK